MVKLNDIDLTIVGGGPAGLFLAKEAKKKGLKIVMFDREERLGGILKQCIHTGFGVEIYKKDLTGPELIEELMDEVLNLDIPYYTKSMCIGFEGDKLYFYSPKGVIEVSSKYFVFSLGARERARGSIFIEGSRPSGVFTAGFAQYITNILGLKIGEKVAILGSGDIGLIMARRLTLEGMEVIGIFEIMPYYGGLPRNIRQCIEDFEIPLYLSHTVVKIEGEERLEKIYVSQVDENLKSVGSIKEFKVDTLLLSVGLIPEIDILRKNLLIDNKTLGPIVNQYFLTNIPNTFVIGNSLIIFDLVDKAMKSSLVVLDYILKERKKAEKVKLIQGNLIRNFIPQILEKSGEKTKIYFRVKEPIFDKEVILREDKKVISNKKFKALYPAEMREIDIDTNLIDRNEIVIEVV
ncbi:MAG: NAD(P)/FAD-dependent oxidoreductase [Caldisericia bacterium]